MGSHVQKKTLEWFDLRPVARGPGITEEGTVYWVSFENEDLWVTKDMATEVLKLLYATKHYKLFTVIGNTDKEPLALDTEEKACCIGYLDFNSFIQQRDTGGFGL